MTQGQQSQHVTRENQRNEKKNTHHHLQKSQKQPGPKTPLVFVLRDDLLSVLGVLP